MDLKNIGIGQFEKIIEDAAKRARETVEGATKAALEQVKSLTGDDVFRVALGSDIMRSAEHVFVGELIVDPTVSGKCPLERVTLDLVGHGPRWTLYLHEHPMPPVQVSSGDYRIIVAFVKKAP